MLRSLWRANALCCCGGHRGRMVVGSTTTYAISAYHHYCLNSSPAHGEVYSIELYVIKLVCVLWQVGGFLLVLRFPPAIKLTDAK